MFYIPSIERKKACKAYRKPESVKILEALDYASEQLKHPSMPLPYIAKRKFRDDNANGLTNCITHYITLKGGFASRINNTGVYDARLKKYRPGTSKRGLPDIISTYRGKSLHIEVKAGKDIQSEAQRKIESEVKQAGGAYYIARNFTDFKLWFDNL